jgi:hypothetical protein
MSRYRETMAEALKKVYEDGHEDVSSSKRMCQTIIEDATQIRTKLDSMSAEDKLDTWWTNKLAKSADNLNSARDYIMNPIEEELQERTYDPIQFGPDKVAKAMAIATKSSGQYSVAVRDIEKIARNLSKVSTIARELKKQNEEVELDEGRMKDIYTMQQDGKSAAEIAKLMKLPVKTVKSILGEEVGEISEENLAEFTSDMIKRLKKSYSTMPQKLSTDQANALSRHLDRLDLTSLKQLSKEKIPFITTLARNKIYKKTGKFEEVEEPKKDNEKKETENKDNTISSLKDQISMLKQKLENEKNKAVKPEPNPDTGEVPLTIGLANKLLKDKEMKKEDINEKKDTEAELLKLMRNINPKSQNYEVIMKGLRARMAKLRGKKEDLDEADLTKPQIKKVHKMADELPKKDFKDRYGKEKGDAVRYATATNIVKKKLGVESTSAFNPKVHNTKLGVTTKDLDRAFKKLSQKAQTHVNDSLRTGMGTRDAIKKAKEKFNEGDTKNEDMRLRIESIAGIKKKAEKSGMPYSILKKVFDRGMAAWKGGHRPGASQHQWAFARVNSFVTKSSGTWGGADKDLAKQVRGSK